jgi:hypothetical protein
MLTKVNALLLGFTHNPGGINFKNPSRAGVRWRESKRYRDMFCEIANVA